MRTCVRTLVFTFLFLSAFSVFAEDQVRPGGGQLYDISRSSVRLTPEVGAGACPCFRWRIGLVGPGGEWISTQEILVSTEAILNLQLTLLPYLGVPTLGELIVKTGGLDVYIKPLRTGIGFRGVEIGHQKDIGYSYVLRTGAYLFAQIIRAQMLGLRFFTGLDYDSVALSGGTRVDRILFPQTLEMRWSSDTGLFKGIIRTTGSFGKYSDELQKKFNASASAQLRVFSAAQFEGFLGLNGEYEYDSMREIFGLQPHRGVFGLQMEIDYVSQYSGQN